MKIHEWPDPKKKKNLFFWAVPHDTKDLGFLIRDQTHALCNGSVVCLNHWTTREVPQTVTLKKFSEIQENTDN